MPLTVDLDIIRMNAKKFLPVSGKSIECRKSSRVIQVASVGVHSIHFRSPA